MNDTPHFGPGPTVLAVDVGGTTMKIARLDAAGTLSPPIRVSTPREGDVGAAIVELIAQEIASGDPVDRIAIGVPGVVDEDRGMAVYSENLGWRDVSFPQLLTERTGLPAVLVHDVRAAGAAERRFGAAQGVDTAAVITIGTGIAASLTIAGRAYAGHGYAGEIGHAIVEPGGDPCICGNRGCLETTSSAAGIVRRYRAAGGDAVTGADEVLARATSGDPIAQQVWNSALDALALGLAHLCATLAPDLIVLGGGLSEARAALIEPLQQRLDALSPFRRTPVTRARLGQDAGVIGAALAGRPSAGEVAQ